MNRVPFNRPIILESAYSYLLQAVDNMHLSGDGPFTKRCHQWLENELGTYKALLTTSCTHALEIAAILLDIQLGDEIIVPSFTFVSTINAFVLRGAKPIFVDIRPDTLNIDERLIPGKITDKTKAIIPVHYAGVSCEMDTIGTIARSMGIPIVEDNAHGLLAQYRGQYLGTFGALATQSFHETKNFSCGEGGALLINDPQYAERAEIIREKGTNRSRFFRGQVDKYTWVDVGSSYLPSDILAALLLSQLETRDTIQANRMQIWNRYQEALTPWAEKHGIGLPVIPEHCQHPAHLYYLLLPSLEDRQKLIEHLKAEGISAPFHYQALHVSPMGYQFGGRMGDCPITEAVSDQLVRLPLFATMTESQQEIVIESIHKFRPVMGVSVRDQLLQMGDRRRAA